jgi:hypothetical protein
MQLNNIGIPSRDNLRYIRLGAKELVILSMKWLLSPNLPVHINDLVERFLMILC